MLSRNDLSSPVAAVRVKDLASRIWLAILVCACVWATGATGQTISPLLVVTDATYTDNTFGAYVSEMLKTEGFLSHQIADS